MLECLVLRTLSLAALALLATAPALAQEVNVYSSRQEALIKPLLDQFSAESGIKVNLVSAKADALIQRLKSEGRNSPADLFLTVDAGTLHSAQTQGLLQPVKSSALEQAVPANYRDPAGHWVGLSVRARPIFYVKGKVDPKQLSTYADLASPKWKRQICVRSSDNIYNQSLVAAFIAQQGEAKTESWVRGLVANMARPPRGGDRDQFKAAAAGQCTLVIANTYYLAGMLAGDDAADREAAAKMGVFWPDQKGRGVHVNISGAGVTAAAKNRDNAVKLLEYLASPAAQAWYAQENHEYPVRKDVPVSERLKGFGEFKADTLNMSQLGENNAAAVKLMDRAGWR